MKIERRKDHYYQKAKKENLPARSVYKLEEINNKHKLIRKGDKVLDIGCAPGSWCGLAGKITGKDGVVVGIDILPVTEENKKGIIFIQKDFFSLTPADLAHIAPSFDCVMSDAAPNTSGDRFTDHQRSLRICEKILDISKTLLKKDGNLLMKVFQGQDFPEFYRSVKPAFKLCKTEKPQSSRKESFEVYIVCKGKL
ncbi:RlmE family RNA methyltransferase [Candidatus Auribacterota bacterium]